MRMVVRIFLRKMVAAVLLEIIEEAVVPLWLREMIDRTEIIVMIGMWYANVVYFSTGKVGSIVLGSTEYGGETHTCLTWFGGAYFFMEGGGMDTYCVMAGCEGNNVLYPTIVGDESAIRSIWLSGAVCVVDDDVLRRGCLRWVLPRLMVGGRCSCLFW